jgi:hypothetical protein
MNLHMLRTDRTLVCGATVRRTCYKIVGTDTKNVMQT